MNEVSRITDGSNFNRRNPKLIRLSATKVVKNIKVKWLHRIDRTLKITQKKKQEWVDNEIYLLDNETGFKVPNRSKEETLEIQDLVIFIFVT